jgi:hypothetical protein
MLISHIKLLITPTFFKLIGPIDLNCIMEFGSTQFVYLLLFS